MMRCLGLMSGTSLDGIDLALIETDGERVAAFGPWRTVPYDAALRDLIRASLGGLGPWPQAEAALTQAHAEAVALFLAQENISPPDLIGFHGQTILHRPAERRTWQLGDGAWLSDRLGMDVVCDFRSADVAAGGQGAPLVPLYHAALARELDKPLAVLNIGGVANVTWIGADGDLLAFDTGPGNAPLDDWMRRHFGQAMDEGGRIAAQGRVDEARLAAALSHPWFEIAPPKSLDRDDFTLDFADGLSPQDGAATLAAFVVRTAARARDHMPAAPCRWLVTGGGRHNPVLMDGLRMALGVDVLPVENVGWRGDALEAEAFAFLAARSRRGLPLSLPRTTGAPEPILGGRYFSARTLSI